MTTVPKRISIKFNVKQNPTFDPKEIVPIFQRWIQEHTVEGMLIDVVDYKHVQGGPGVILIADEGDYGYDLSEGRVGLQYTRKRFLPDNLRDALQLVFRLGFVAAQQLENEAVLDGIEFDFSSAKINFLDRQTYRNQPDTFDAIQGEISAFLSNLYGESVTISCASDDPREIFGVRYTLSTPVNIATIKANIAPQTVTI